MKYSQLIEESLNTLKDFQKATVNYVVAQMHAGQRKFLIADEVGLGKTIVAKGILARLYQQYYSPKKDFRIIYICSNQALAKQNLTKLNFLPGTGDTVIDYNDEDDRLTSLAYEPKEIQTEYRLRIKALTPTTSFDHNRRSGKADERVLLYRLLMHIPGMEYRLVSLRWFLKGGQQISGKTWTWKTDNAWLFENNKATYGDIRPIRAEVYKKFSQRLRSRLSDENQKRIFGTVRENCSVLKGLFELLEERKQNRSFEDGRDIVFKNYYSLIAELRLHLSYVCKDYLQADVFVLDEFQKFSQLIRAEEAENKGEEIARIIFADPKSKVLLLSATPFKPFTNAFDEHNGEHHYKDFREVLRFLNPDKPPVFWENLEASNTSFFNHIMNFGSGDIEIPTIVSIKKQIEGVYRECMVRTERTLVTNEENNLSSTIKYLELKPEDVNDFIAIDRIVLSANEVSNNKLSHPVEYVKSSPFPLSFLQDYDHHKVLQKVVADHSVLKKLIAQTKHAFVPVEKVNAYKALLPERSIHEPNPKLRLLYEETVRNNGFRLLWIPPCIKYYQTKGGAYSNTEDFSKTLIFSAWKMVPRMVSALVSYEAERLSIGRLFDQESVREKYSYRDKKRYPFPLLTFRRTENGLSGMNNLMLAYPSIYLASLYNPVNNVYEQKDLSRIKNDLKRLIVSKLKSLNVLSLGSTGGNIQKWDWLAVLLLDKHHTQAHELKSWLNEGQSDISFDAENETDNKDSDTNKSAKQIHFQEIRNYILTNTFPEVGKLNEEQLGKIGDHLVNLCLGGPGISSLRAIEQTYPTATRSAQLSGAFDIGLGMISMFNKPESIAVVKVAEDDNFYYQNVLSYAIDGNIQAMLDEFLYQLKDSGSISECGKACDLVKNILMVGSSKIDVITEESIRDDKHFPMRTHYAVPFGSSESSDLKNGKRQIKVREAFNSPFRPFVLTSTSIGQEGLDFHFYCKKIIHWNLPNNPIDLEQREGRIKRYKSLLVRKNVTKLYKEAMIQAELKVPIWEALFDYASRQTKICDLIPYWHVPTDNNTIESIVPLYRYSKDISKYQNIKRVLANYRLTFGQPDQQELIEVLDMIDPLKREQLRQLLISLSPLTFSTEPA